MGWVFWNLVASIGAFTIAAGFLVFVFNVVKSRNNICTDPDPWDARTLEWGTSSPPPVHNFDIEPSVESLNEWWYRKYDMGDDHKLHRREHIEYLGGGEPQGAIHLPSPSYWPIIIAAGLPFVGYRLMYSFLLGRLGRLVT